jgi:hypothetical protein
MKSWSNTGGSSLNISDAYIRWIEYTQLTNVREETSLRYKCTHMANLLQTSTTDFTRVILKKIVDGRNAQQFDFYQVS